MDIKNHGDLSRKQVIRGLLLIVFGCALALVLYSQYQSMRHQSRLQASIPKVLAEMAQQRDRLVQAIEAYKQHYGAYPPSPRPDSTASGVWNPLFYELAGTRRDDAHGTFYDRTQKEPVGIAEMEKAFGLRCFTNSLPFPTWPVDFLSDKQLGKKSLADGAELFGVGFNESDIPDSLTDDFHISAWRYTARSPAHNPAQFDLWIEMDVASRHYLVGNWSGQK